MPLLGAESRRMHVESDLDLAQTAGVQIVRINGVLWHQTELQEGQPQWENLANLDQAIENLTSRGIEVILIIRGTPGWAQKVVGSNCGPIHPDKLEAFTTFVRQLVERYTQPPYYVRYWELGNEPDVDPRIIAAGVPFGCWGDEHDPYYGGEYYAEMLKRVYPVIKQVNPEAQVLVGGLLLDCDPGMPPEGKDCLPARFLEGILLAGGGEFFDIVSYHGYPPFIGDLTADLNYPTWAHRGGVTLGKADYIRDVLSEFRYDKPLFHTETSLICPEWNPADCDPPKPVFYEDQAEYVVRLYVRNWAHNIASTIWYTFEGPGWRFGGMVGSVDAPRPAYHAFTYLAETLTDGVYIGRVDGIPGAEGYRFSRGSDEVWVIWPEDETERTIQLPTGFGKITDKLGNEITPENGQVYLQGALYIEFP